MSPQGAPEFVSVPMATPNDIGRLDTIVHFGHEYLTDVSFSGAVIDALLENRGISHVHQIATRLNEILSEQGSTIRIDATLCRDKVGDLSRELGFISLSSNDDVQLNIDEYKLFVLPATEE